MSFIPKDLIKLINKYKKDNEFRVAYYSEDAGGEISALVIVKRGLSNGLERDFHQYGRTIQEEYLYKNDKLNGLHRGFYESGQVRNEVNYINDKKEGIDRWFFRSGRIMEDDYYVNNKKEGTHNYWDLG